MEMEHFYFPTAIPLKATLRTECLMDMGFIFGKMGLNTTGIDMRVNTKTDFDMVWVWILYVIQLNNKFIDFENLWSEHYTCLFFQAFIIGPMGNAMKVNLRMESERVLA